MSNPPIVTAPITAPSLDTLLANRPWEVASKFSFYKDGLADYDAFLASKLPKPKTTGFHIEQSALGRPDSKKHLLDWQKAIVQWAIRLGRAAIFADCGLGKTAMQLEYAYQIALYTRRKMLVCSPLAVAHQTIKEGVDFGIPAVYCRSQKEADAAQESIIVTNYEMLKAFDPAKFVGIVIDESSILKAYVGARKRQILEFARGMQYKLAPTATPSPNDHLELGNHAEFLEIMDSSDMIAMFFTNDTMKAGGYYIKPHGEKYFWQWVATWAVCVSKPSDLGNQYSDDGYILPQLIIHDAKVEADYARAWEQGRLFYDGTQSATNLWKEKRATIPARCDEAIATIVSQLGNAQVVWCGMDEEESYISTELTKRGIDHVVVTGKQSQAKKEAGLNAFSDGKANIIITKFKIAGFGLNWQHSHHAVIVCPTFSFEMFYQGIRRQLRFGQTHDVHATLIYAESETAVIDAIVAKQSAFAEMQENMKEAMTVTGIIAANQASHLQPAIYDVATGRDWEMYLGDCVTNLRRIVAERGEFIDLSVFSPPFEMLYTYSDRLEDMGNSANPDEFYTHMAYLAVELWNATKPGRLCAIHCKDLPRYKGSSGAFGIVDLPGQLRAVFEHFGWIFHSRVTIWKDPVLEMEKTNSHGLLHKNFASRSEVTRQGLPDYLLVFGKRGDGFESPDNQVTQYRQPGDYIGTEPPEGYDTQTHYSIKVWQKYASPVWYDIRQTNVLNGYKNATQSSDGRHICPLQLDVIARCIDLWSQRGDTIFTPFAGIGSELYTALLMHRKAIGIELKPSYWSAARLNCEKAALESTQTSFLDMSAA